MLMAQEAPPLNIVDGAGDVSQPVRPLSQTLRPHYFTTFQKTCCIADAKLKTTRENKSVLPIPQKFRDETIDLVKCINSDLIQDLPKLSKWTSRIPDEIFTPYEKYHPDRYLIDRPLLRTMEDARVINWMPSVAKLYPIRTSGNGNCLLHAVLIAIAGVHDVDLCLRDRLIQFMNENKQVLQNYWRNERLESDKQYGISSEDSKLDAEWAEVCDLVRYENSEDGQAATQLRFLEAIHIFSISNLLQRPIIVLSEKYIRNLDGEAVSVNDLFGIYLPILLTPEDCCHQPIVLAYNQSHFCPFQTSRVSSGTEIWKQQLPLYPTIDDSYDQKLLPTRFLSSDVAKQESSELLSKYLNITELPHSFDAASPPLKIQCAELGTKGLSKRDDFLLLYHDYCKDFFGVQLPNALAEERRRADRQRDQDDYNYQRTTYSTEPGRHFTTASLPRLEPYRRIAEKHNGTSQRREHELPTTDVVHMDAYTPRTDGVLVSNHQLKLNLAATLSEPASATPRSSGSDFIYGGETKPSMARIDAENIDNPHLREKDTNRPSAQPTPQTTYRDGQAQPRKVTEIKVQYVGQPSTTSNTSAYSLDSQSPLRGRCLDCHRLLSDPSAGSVCDTCFYNKYRPEQYESPTRPLTGRSPRTNIYPSSSYTRDTDILFPRVQTRAARFIACPNCGSPNMSSGVGAHSNFYCSACRAMITSANNH